MEFIIIHPETGKQFIFSDTPSSREGNAWVERCDGEGTEFNKNELAKIIYEAIDKYFVDIM